MRTIFQVLTDLLPLPLLIWMAAADWKDRRIPNISLALLLLLSLAVTPIHPIPFPERLLGFLFPALPLFFLAIRTDKMKGGDVKYLAALSSYAGLYRMAAVLLIGTLIALLWAMRHRAGSIPLAYFICIGYVIQIVLTYLS